MIVRTGSPAATHALGVRMGEHLGAGDVVELDGDLGAGKTLLTKGIAVGLGVDEPVTSPTFAIVQEYAGRLPVFHLDAYRLSSPAELVGVGFDDIVDAGGVVVIEWGERVAPALPERRLVVRLRAGDGDDARELELEPRGQGWDDVLAAARDSAGGVD